MCKLYNTFLKKSNIGGINMDIRLPIKRKRGGQGKKEKEKYKESLQLINSQPQAI